VGNAYMGFFKPYPAAADPIVRALLMGLLDNGLLASNKRKIGIAHEHCTWAFCIFP
jgi:hypothetical protein